MVSSRTVESFERENPVVVFIEVRPRARLGPLGTSAELSSAYRAYSRPAGKSLGEYVVMEIEEDAFLQSDVPYGVQLMVVSGLGSQHIVNGSDIGQIVS